MNLKFITIIGLLVLFYSCNDSNKSSINESENKGNLIDTLIPLNVAKIEINKGEILYFGESDSIRQHLIISYLDSNKIKYRIIATSKYYDCRQTWDGIASNKYKNMDLEIDEDNEGVAYPVIEFWDIKEDNVSIRIGENKEFARISFPVLSDTVEICARLKENILIKKKNSQ